MTTATELMIDHIAWTRDADQRQDIITALIDADPATEAEAAEIAQRIRWAHQRQRRRERRYVGDMPDAELVDTPTPQSSPTLDAVQRLPEHLRRVMLLRFVSELSVAEVAERLRVSVPTIVRWSKTAMKKIRDG